MENLTISIKQANSSLRYARADAQTYESQMHYKRGFRDGLVAAQKGIQEHMGDIVRLEDFVQLLVDMWSRDESTEIHRQTMCLAPGNFPELVKTSTVYKMARDLLAKAKGEPVVEFSSEPTKKEQS